MFCKYTYLQWCKQVNLEIFLGHSLIEKAFKLCKKFEQYEVFSYLIEGFEVLHTQSREYMVADIEEYMNHKKAISNGIIAYSLMSIIRFL